MTKKMINVFENAKEIMEALQKGVLLTTRTDHKVNSMVISWGTLGIEWSKPIFTVFVRENRYTRKQLDQNPEFTINIPIGDYDKNIIRICGTKSGHDIDKIAEAGLTVISSDIISVPAIREFPLTLECKVVYRQEQIPGFISEENRRQFYPQDVDSSFHGANMDYHTAYYGEIVNAYLITD